MIPRRDFDILGALLVQYGGCLDVQPNPKQRTIALLRGADRFSVEIGWSGRSHPGEAIWYALKEAKERARDGQIPMGIIYDPESRDAYLMAPVRLLGEVT